MFGFGPFKKNAEKAKKTATTSPPAYQSVLSQYRSDAFPVGIEPSMLDASSSDEHCVLQLPFAAAQESEQISAFLSEHMGQRISVQAHVVLNESPRLAAIKHIILVSSGKGGVGKSTCAVRLAQALRDEGAQVVLLDADIYGPSLPLLLDLQGQKPQAKDKNTLLPFDTQGLKAQSIGFLVDPDDATVWRGPMASQALVQLLNETHWGELDYLIVDMPPGTGDIQLTMSQKVPASGAVIVTTPQDLALADAHKGVKMLEKVHVPVLGLIENMSQFECPHCGEHSAIFGHDGASNLAQRYGVPILAHIPLHVDIRNKQHTHNEKLKTPFSKAARTLASQLYYQQAPQQGVNIIITDD